ncbi:MAG TPA: hypothetical protein VNH64_04900 [Parvularculaceae bacterium]|nr:hypothetical protein [Parvularculaceae bacterium]
MKDASNLESATVDTYWIAISEDEFTSIMEKLRKLATIPAESPPRDDGMYCLHEAGAYFESVEAGERVFFARRGCDADFGDVVLQAAPLVDLATKRLPSAAKKFDFVISLFEDMAEKKKKSDE